MKFPCALCGSIRLSGSPEPAWRSTANSPAMKLSFSMPMDKHLFQPSPNSRSLTGCPLYKPPPRPICPIASLVWQRRRRQYPAWLVHFSYRCSPPSCCRLSLRPSHIPPAVSSSTASCGIGLLHRPIVDYTQSVLDSTYYVVEQEVVMNIKPICLLLALVWSAAALAQSPPAPREGALKSLDGTPLKATFFAAPRPGPALLLLHQSNRDRRSWFAEAAQLAAAGFNTAALDLRGFGESAGQRGDFKRMPEDV